jgi:hypothetical protein
VWPGIIYGKSLRLPFLLWGELFGAADLFGVVIYSAVVRSAKSIRAKTVLLYNRT